MAYPHCNSFGIVTLPTPDTQYCSNMRMYELCCLSIVLQPQYLESTGFAAKGLLQAPEQGGSSSKLAVFEDDTTASSDENLLVMLSAKAAEGIEHVGNTVASLGRWMRSRIVGDQAAAARTTEAAAERASDSSNGVNKRVDSVLGAVMVICVAIVAVVVLRKPAALKEVFKRVRLVRRA